jgi:hypothetical protein
MSVLASRLLLSFNLLKNVWNNCYLKSGWLIPLVGICLWFGALWLYKKDFIPLWAFAVLAVFCEP